MLDGINVLAHSTTLVEIGTTWGFSIAAIASSILLILGLIVIYIMVTEKDFPPIGIFSAIVLIAIGIWGWSQKPIKQECAMYKATIEDNVSFNEFNQRYIVLNKEGDLYTFRERAETEKYK